MSRCVRLKEVIQYLKQSGVIKLQKDFASQLGMSAPNLSSAISGDTKYLSDAFFRRIVTNYPQFSLRWLLSGEGVMLANPDIVNTSSSNLPLIHIDSVGGIHSDNAIVAPEYIERYVPFMDSQADDFCIYQSGESMSPTIPSGAILHLREVVNWQEYFGYGGYFVLLLADGRRITKQVLRGETDPNKFVLCKSINPDHSDEELPRSFIRRVFKIINVLTNNGW